MGKHDVCMRSPHLWHFADHCMATGKMLRTQKSGEATFLTSCIPCPGVQNCSLRAPPKYGTMKSEDKTLMADQKEFLSRLSGMPIEHGVPMRTLTTFHVGGPADYVLHVQDEAMLLRALSAAKACGVPVYLLGNGSNILVRDKGIRGLVLLLSGEAFSSFRQDGTTVEAGAGMNLTALARECLSAGLMGLEWAPGIPGTLGGACAMNAGAYGGEMKQVLRAVRVLENGEIINRAVQNGEARCHS